MTLKEKLAEAEAKLRLMEELVPGLERNRSTVEIAKRIKSILGLPDQKALF